MIFNYSLQFLSPIALFVLVALPIIYIVSRFVPKPPKSINFGAIFILKNIIAPRPIPKHAPLWLKILRLFLAGIFILACSLRHADFAKSKFGKNNFKRYIIGH